MAALAATQRNAPKGGYLSGPRSQRANDACEFDHRIEAATAGARCVPPQQTPARMRSPVRQGGAADVVVLGGGGAGLSAAIQRLRPPGRSVILLRGVCVWASAVPWSVGSVSATSTPHQIRRGIKDRPNDHFEDLAALSGPLSPRDNPLLRRLLVEDRAGHVPLTAGLGIVFFGPMPEPPHRRPRMHNVLPSSRAFIDRLAAARACARRRFAGRRAGATALDQRDMGASPPS